MRWKNLFTPVQAIDADEARAFMARHPESSYTLLDVRQPGEYEKEHLPGAKLVPLPNLSEALAKLDPLKPIIVY
jgi:sulfur-carrier protein adenylyltransferase/sulfurtransferase